MQPHDTRTNTVILIASCALIITFAPSVTFAQATISVSPNIPFATISSTTCPSYFLAGFYKFALLIGGVLAFGAIVYGGVLYASSGGNPSKQSDGKEYIQSALIGLVLLGAAYLILFMINPNIVNLSLPQLPGQTAGCTGANLGVALAPAPTVNVSGGGSIPGTQCAGGVPCQQLPNCTAGARVSCGGAPAMVDMLNNCVTQQDPNASYRVSEGYPPTPAPTGAPTHTSRGHNNGCSIDVVLTGSATCPDVAALRAAVKSCGGDTEQEYENCPEYVPTLNRTGDHLHINAPHKGRDTGSC